ncbi:hypothetical protein V5O48_017561, partial [Marasmius crinis-equi]
MVSLTAETSLTAVEQAVSAADNDERSSLTNPLVIVALLVAMGVVLIKVIKWLYPYTLGDLQSQIKAIERIIEKNTTLERNLLGELGWDFKKRLSKLYQKMLQIRNGLIVEPDRRNCVAWVVFHWREKTQVKACYLALMELKRDIT